MITLQYRQDGRPVRLSFPITQQHAAARKVQALREAGVDVQISGMPARRCTDARFLVRKVACGIVWITDEDGHGCKSVTNDAERVCAVVNAAYPCHRIIYRDTMGKWDELAHDNGRFTGYLPARSMDINLDAPDILAKEI
jgi:hypothetical protein